MRLCTKRRLLYTVLAIAASVSLILTLYCSTAFSACNIQAGDNGNWQHTGGGEDVASIQGVKARLWNYNPNPVFEQSMFWVMLTKAGTLDRWVQLGWVKTSTYANEYIWCQYTSDAMNVYNYFFDVPNNTWSLTPTSIPGADMTYEIGYNSGSPGVWVRYSGGNALGFHHNWVPSRLEVSAEETNYAAPNKGDHVPGDTSHPIQANAVQKKVNGSWQNASLTYTSEGNGGWDIYNNTPPGFRVWDVRCSQ